MNKETNEKGKFIEETKSEIRRLLSIIEFKTVRRWTSMKGIGHSTVPTDEANIYGER